MSTKKMNIEWWFLFFTISAIEGSWKVQKSSEDFVAEKTLKILLESCYKNNELSNPIIIFGDYDDFIDESSIIRINTSFKALESSKNNGLFNFKASKVILIENISKELQSDVKLLKKTKWWNHVASFFIIIKNNEECKNFRDILTITWKMNIINSILICSLENTSVLYTLNPFANYAPYPWKKIGDDENFHVFHQDFNANISCSNLNYHKTRNLHYYKINVAASSRGCAYFRSRNDHVNPPKYRRSAYLLFLDVIIGALNASCNLECESNTNDMLQRLKNHTIDLSLWGFALSEHSDKLMLNSYISSEIFAIVQLNPEVPTLHKIIHMWSPPVLIGASIILAIFFIILTIIYRNYSSALLDLTRLLTYISIKLDNRSNSFRIYFTTILIFMVISNGVFQGKIAAYLTKPERFPTIETIDELIELNYKFYTYEGSEGSMESQCPKCNMKSVPISDCIDFVDNNTFNVCVIDEPAYYFYNWSQLDVEPIKNPLNRVYWKHLCRDDWPLYNRVNDLSSVIMESGLSNFWMKKIIYLNCEKRRVRDDESNSPHYRPVKFGKLDFAFEFLAIGLALSVCSFFIEVLIGKYGNP